MEKGLLSGLKFFELFGQDSLELAESRFCQQNLPKGEKVVSIDLDAPPGMFFILSGEAKVSLFSSDGKEMTLAVLEAGDFFGELSMLTGETPSADVIARTELELAYCDPAGFGTLLKNTDFSQSLLKSLAERLSAASSKIGDLALLDVYRRVAHTLKGMARELSADDGSKRLIIESRPTHSELAAMTGTSREMVTRALKGLEEDGCIKTEGKKVEFIKLPR